MSPLEIKEQFRNAAIKQRNESGVPWRISWQLRPYDGDERCWDGYLDGELAYTVHRGGYFFHLADPLGHDYGDACDSEQTGINCCEAHALYGENWPKSKQLDPILSQDGGLWQSEPQSGGPN
jgi:hypothetical protein